MSTQTDFARIHSRGSVLSRYYNPALDEDLQRREAGIYGTTPYHLPLVVISPTPPPPAPTPDPPPEVPVMYYLALGTLDRALILTLDDGLGQPNGQGLQPILVNG